MESDMDYMGTPGQDPGEGCAWLTALLATGTLVAGFYLLSLLA